MSDVFEGAQEIAPSQVSFGKVGDYVIGYYQGHKVITTSNGDSKLYELKGIQGEFHVTTNGDDGNGNKVTTVAKEPTKISVGDFYTVWGGKSKIDDLFAKAKLGQKVGVRFEAAIPSKTKGHSAFKDFKTVMWDEYDTSNPISDVFPGSEVEGVNM